MQTGNSETVLINSSPTGCSDRFAASSSPSAITW